MDERQVWGLHHDGRRVADLVVYDGDFPWLNAKVARLPGYEAVEHYFRAEYAALREERAARQQTFESAGTGVAWGIAYDGIRAEVTMTYPDGGQVPEFLLHIQGDEAWWRWLDEPFDDTDDA